MYERRIRHVIQIVRPATPSPMTESAFGESACWPTSVRTPAIAVPAWLAPPEMNARTWSRRASGTTLISVSQAGDATPCNHTITTARDMTRVANAELASRIPNEPPYKTGNTRTTAAAPSQASNRFAKKIEITKATIVTTAPKTPRNPASASGSGYRAVDASANGRNSE